jgi:hypothetical protein
MSGLHNKTHDSPNPHLEAKQQCRLPATFCQCAEIDIGRVFKNSLSAGIYGSADFFDHTRTSLRSGYKSRREFRSEKDQKAV